MLRFVVQGFQSEAAVALTVQCRTRSLSALKVCRCIGQDPHSERSLKSILTKAEHRKPQSPETPES